MPVQTNRTTSVGGNGGGTGFSRRRQRRNAREQAWRLGGAASGVAE